MSIYKRPYRPDRKPRTQHEWDCYTDAQRERRKIKKLERELDQAAGKVKQRTEKPHVDVGTDPWADMDGAA